MAEVDLLIVDDAPDGYIGTSFGGIPLVPAEFNWPVCASCASAMQFLGQVPAPDGERWLLVFLCQNDPGGCEEWNPEEGGNAVFSVPPSALSPAKVPDSDEAIRPLCYGARVEHVTAEGYDAARMRWTEATGRRGRDVLGQLGGTPDWLQGDATPNCDACGAPMTLAAQLEQGPDHRHEMNFGGGGSAYVFACRCDSNGAKFLWQC